MRGMYIRSVLLKVYEVTPEWLLNKMESLLTRPIFRPFASALSERVKGKGKIGGGAGEGLFFDATGARSAYLLGTYCKEEQSFLVSHTSSGDVFYDIGAHVGFYAVIGARLVGESGKVVAFEPIPEMVNRCKINLSENDFSNFVLVESAVGCEKKSSMFSVKSEKQGSKLSEDGSIEVKVVPLDEWIEENKSEPPDVMIIDAEGNELNVLRGAIRTIKKYKPDICVEVHGEGGHFLEYVNSNINPLGYTVDRLGGGEVPTSSDTHFRAILEPDGSSE